MNVGMGRLFRSIENSLRTAPHAVAIWLAALAVSSGLTERSVAQPASATAGMMSDKISRCAMAIAPGISSSIAGGANPSERHVVVEIIGEAAAAVPAAEAATAAITAATRGG